MIKMIKFLKIVLIEQLKIWFIC